MRHFIVPVDGSSASWRAVEVATALAARCKGRVEAVQVLFDPNEEHDVSSELRSRVDAVPSGDVEIVPIARLATTTDRTVADEICALVAQQPGTTVVMASQGRGRSVAVVGSVAEDLLRCLADPIVIVGPQSAVPDFSNPMIVTLDGSDFSEAALPIAASWNLELGPQPTLLRVIEPDDRNADDAQRNLESAAELLSTLSQHKVPFTLQHDRDVGSAVASYARDVDASLIVTSTHGHTGLPRFVLGSTAAAFVRQAPCPVLLIRPAHAAATERLPRAAR